MTKERENYEKNIIKRCFIDKDAFLQCIEKIPNDDFFYHSVSRLIWQVYCMIYEQGQEINYSVVNDVLTHTDNNELIKVFKGIVEHEYEDEDAWEYHLSYLIERYRKELLINMSNYIRKEISNKSSEELLIESNQFISNLNATEIRTKTFDEAFRKTIKDIKDIAGGKITSLLSTNHSEIDDIVSLGGKSLVMLAAQKKIGKTRFIVHLIDRLVNHNTNIDVQWYSFEMQSDEMIRLFISKKIGLKDKQLMSINYKLSPNEIMRIEAGYQYFNNYPIEFVDETANVFNICSRFERFATKSKQKNHIPICVIDNLGLIKPHQKNDLQNEDDIARMFKDLRDKTEGLIIVLHHLSKESESKFNVTEMYRPKVTHIRGSSRLVDFANKVLLLHRPEMYNDVVKHFRKEGKEHLIKDLMEVNCALNRNGDTGTIDLRHDLGVCNFIDIKNEE